jgi:uncharacterized repeat protein (TIGR03803 family)
MKTHVKNLLFLSALVAGLGLTMAGRVTAQTLTTLYSFSELDEPPYTNSDGANASELVLSGDTLYGAAAFGGLGADGTAFAVNTDGTGFTVLWSFSALNPSTNSDGAHPYSGFALAGNTLYGMTFHGGPSAAGTLFAINTDGTDFTVIHAFSRLNVYYPHTNYDGMNPMGGLLLSGNTLYGTTYAGGTADAGIVFKVNTDGTGFTNLHSFQTLNNRGATNSDGGNPEGYLTLAGNTLYGTARAGGTAGFGTIFKVNTDGTGFAALHSFSAIVKGTNSDGISPGVQLIVSGSALYGTAGGGGKFGGGTIFVVNTNGTGFTILHSFASAGIYPYFNSGGAGPTSPMALSGSTLYGSSGGGSSGAGTLFAVNTDGTGFTTLYNFSGGDDGADPDFGVILSGGTLYGATYNGGANGSGAVFSFALP